MSAQLQGALRILRRRQLEAKIGLGRTAIYERLNPKSPSYDPDFPKPIKLGIGKNPPVGWDESQVDAWLASRVAASRPAEPAPSWRDRIKSSRTATAGGAA